MDGDLNDRDKFRGAMCCQTRTPTDTVKQAGSRYVNNNVSSMTMILYVRTENDKRYREDKYGKNA